MILKKHIQNDNNKSKEFFSAYENEIDNCKQKNQQRTKQKDKMFILLIF